MQKYRNKKIVIDGKKFDSKKEANRFIELSIFENRSEIYDLQTQVRFEIIPKNNKFRSIIYVADFVYIDNNGNMIVEDVKGYKRGAAYAMFKVKQKLMYYFHKIEVIEI